MLYKKIGLSKRQIVKATFQLPGGITKVLDTAHPSFLTDDVEVIDFFSKQKNVYVVDADDQAFLSYAKKRQTELPRIQKRELTIGDVLEHKWTTEEEDKLADLLKGLGWRSWKPKTKG